MRFDDSLSTVLAADSSTAFGAQATFRQLVDLVARERVAANDETLERLRFLRDQVPAAVRASVARGLALARPPATLVRFFAEDEPEIASVALRSARLSTDSWVELLPRLGPAGRAALRQRDDLEDPIVRALESFGSTDFALGYSESPAINLPTTAPVELSTFIADDGLTDVLAIATRRAAHTLFPVLEQEPNLSRASAGYQIADLVDRIASFQRDRSTAAPAKIARPVDNFRFEAGAEGRLRWTDATPRGAIVGVMLATTSNDAAQVDGVVAQAFRQRTSFTDARLIIAGESALAGEWRISGVPVFDPANGRFSGYRGGARRPHTLECAGRQSVGSRAEGLRRLVHELRTPTNAIAGFSELIEAQLLGPVASVYRERASAIRTLAADLVAAIEDLDLAARIEGDALELRSGVLPVAPLLARVVGELLPLAALRGSTLVIDEVTGDDTLALSCDDRAAERLLGRLLGTMVSAGQIGEAITVSAEFTEGVQTVISITRPRALAGVSEAQLLSLDVEQEVILPGAPLLGTGFALRLIRNLAGELGGGLTIGPDRLTLALPAASAVALELVSPV